MKKLLVLALFAVASLSASVAEAVPQHRLGVDGGVRIPFGDWADVTGIVGIGGLFRYEYLGISPQLSITARLGYIFGLSKDVNGADVSTSELPILGGVKYFFTGYTSGKREGMYVAGELGMVYIKFKASASGFGSVSTSETKFGLMAGAGYEVSNWDFGARFFAPSLGDFGDYMGLVATVGYSFYTF